MKHEFSLSINKYNEKNVNIKIIFIVYCLHTSSICILVSILVEYSNYSNKWAFRGATLIRGEALIRGRRLFQCGYPKVRRLLEGGAYLRPAAY